MKRHNAFIVVLGFTASLLGLSTLPGVAADKWMPADHAVAAAQKYFFHLGVSAVPYDENGVVTVVPGPTVTYSDAIRLDPSYTAYFEAGYFLTPEFAVSLSSGYPPTGTAWGAGPIAVYGALGKVTAGIVELNVQYHFRNFGKFQPYIGAGPAYLHVFSTQDATLHQFKVKDAFGANVQIGADWMLTEHMGLFFDLKKVFMTTTASGLVSGVVPASANIRLDPTIISAGLTLRY